MRYKRILSLGNSAPQSWSLLHTTLTQRNSSKLFFSTSESSTMVYPSHFALTAVIAVGAASFSFGAPLVPPPAQVHPSTMLSFNDPLGRALQSPTGGALNMMTRELDTRNLGAVIIEDEPMPHLVGPFDYCSLIPIDDHPFSRILPKMMTSIHLIRSTHSSRLTIKHNEDSKELVRRQEKEKPASLFDPYHKTIADCRDTANSNEKLAAQCDAMGFSAEAQTLRGKAKASTKSAEELQQQVNAMKIKYGY
ncbi:hypothetical protein F5050DRAFT_1047210 [Lentinula boryana]|uniref:Uncharacterized protein n=1 Tax=Lentinula boryana TaxID=40481 RepID=A0ABQ8Q0N5_9AGAR|nr:hypothetical protein F5050DRAFT_1047210 [Lentinula boryana]